MKHKIEQVRVLLFNNEEIGMGFNSDTGLAVGTALDFDSPTREPGQAAQSSTLIVNTHDALMQALETRQDEWDFQGIAPGGDMFQFMPEVPPDAVFVRIFVRSTGKLAGALAAGDRTKTLQVLPGPISSKRSTPKLCHNDH